MPLSSSMVPLGTSLPAFTLPTADGSREYSSADFAGAPALLVMFMCVHCPYAKHVENALGELISGYHDVGLATVAISSNDIELYPDDAPEHMVEQAKRSGWTFPYLFDKSQQVARAFQAVCTPDFFLYDADQRLAYRGQFDSSRHKNDIPVSGEDLKAAIDAVLAGQPVPEPHTPSQGCGIKWTPGNEPPIKLLVD